MNDTLVDLHLEVVVTSLLYLFLANPPSNKFHSPITKINVIGNSATQELYDIYGSLVKKQ
jgi:hypothetical protein